MYFTFKSLETIFEENVILKSKEITCDEIFKRQTCFDTCNLQCIKNKMN